MLDTTAEATMIAGALLMLVAAIGVLRFPGAAARMHAATKGATGGLILVCVGAAFHLGGSTATLLTLVVVFQLVTAPIAGHILGRAALGSRDPAARGLVRDDYGHGDQITAAAKESPDRERLPIASLLVLTGAWCLLWGNAAPGTIIGGVAAATVVLAVGAPRQKRFRFRVRGVPGLASTFIGALVRGTIDVAAEVLTRDNSSIRQAIVRVDLPDHSLATLVLTAAMVTLTPGSLTVALDEEGKALYVHVLHYDESTVHRDVHRLATSASGALRQT